MAGMPPTSPGCSGPHPAWPAQVNPRKLCPGSVWKHSCALPPGAASSFSPPCAHAQTFSHASALTQLLLFPGSQPVLLLRACTRISVQKTPRSREMMPCRKTLPSLSGASPKAPQAAGASLAHGILPARITHSLARGRALLEAAPGTSGNVVPARGVPSGAGDKLGGAGGDSSPIRSVDVTPRIHTRCSCVPAGADSLGAPQGVARQSQNSSSWQQARFAAAAPRAGIRNPEQRQGERSWCYSRLREPLSGNGAWGQNRAWGSSCQNEPW